MRKATKIALMVAGACVVAGALVAGGALAALGFDFRALSTTELQERTYEVQESFQSIEISVPESDVRLLPAADGQCRVVCAEGEQITDTVTVENGTLTITRQDARKWYQHIGISWEDAPAVTVYLPEAEYQSLTVQTTSGEIDLEDVSVERGACITSVSGDVELERFDADSIQIKTVSGDVEGSLCSPKNFVIQTTSGWVQTPSSDSAAGECAVTTTSGDIRLELAD
jgi:DUF4097 and DUF4098 domain-containing protein YvlB